MLRGKCSSFYNYFDYSRAAKNFFSIKYIPDIPRYPEGVNSPVKSDIPRYPEGEGRDVGMSRGGGESGCRDVGKKNGSDIYIYTWPLQVPDQHHSDLAMDTNLPYSSKHGSLFSWSPPSSGEQQDGLPSGGCHDALVLLSFLLGSSHAYYRGNGFPPHGVLKAGSRGPPKQMHTDTQCVVV